MSKQRDVEFMRRALLLAKKGLGQTSPNPAVGAVVVKSGKIIGEGWHRAAGLAHAEVEAIENAERGGHRINGADIYVTLEPCCTQGRTPACTDLLVKKQIRRVIVGAQDPNPKHLGRGFRFLREQGIKVETGVLEEECSQLNYMWNYWMTHQRPWVIAKTAMSLDGKIATVESESQWITSEKSRREAHRLRTKVDGVVIGANTMIRDNPLLNVRYGIRGKQPLRIILDSVGRTPLSARMFREIEEDSSQIWIFSGKEISAQKLSAFEKIGVKVTPVRSSNQGIDLRELLRILGKNDVTSLLIEGGGNIMGSFFYESLVNELAFFVAPKVIAGRNATKAVGGKGFSEWRKGLSVESMNLCRIGSDLLITGMIGSKKAKHTSPIK